MTGILTQLKTVARDLNELHPEWALIGALAVSVYTEPRTTRDIDVAIALSFPNDFEALEKQLIQRGYGSSQLLMHMAPTHKMGFRLTIPCTSSTPLALDLLFSSCGIEREIVKSAVKLEVFPSLLIPVASLPHVLAMKVLSENDSDRIRDRADVQKLIAHASLEDLSATKEALALIDARGFSRNKKLLHEFELDIARYRK